MSASAYILSVKQMENNSHKGILILLKSAAVAVGAAAAVIYSDKCSRGISEGIRFCTSVLVPSLFIFMVLTAYIIKSGSSAIIAKSAEPLMKLFKLPPQASAPILLSVIGGYPIGAGCVQLLHEQGALSDSEAEKAAYIAVAAGPGFIINYVGRSLIGSAAAGNILLLSQITAVFATGIIAGRTIRCHPPKTRFGFSENSDNAFVSSVISASTAALRMCAVVILFSAVIEVIGSVADKELADVLSAFLEVTNGCERLSDAIPLPVTAFFIGFGGVSVHFQIFASLKSVRVNKLVFFLFRLTEGIIALASAYIFLMTVPIETDVFSSTAEPLNAMSSATLFGSGALIFASVCFIGSLSNRFRRIDYVRNSRMDRQLDRFER